MEDRKYFVAYEVIRSNDSKMIANEVLEMTSTIPDTRQIRLIESEILRTCVKNSEGKYPTPVKVTVISLNVLH